MTLDQKQKNIRTRIIENQFIEVRNSKEHYKVPAKITEYYDAIKKQWVEYDSSVKYCARCENYFSENDLVFKFEFFRKEQIKYADCPCCGRMWTLAKVS